MMVLPILAAATLAGWGLRLAYERPETGLATLRAFGAGGIILNVIEEELPQERESRFGAFALGVAGYSLLLAL